MSHDMMLAAIVTGGVLVGLFIVIGLPVVLTVRNSAQQRELEHAERMKALELGRPWPGDKVPEVESVPERATDRGGHIGIWVPLGALGIAFAATSSQPQSAHGADIAVWISAAAVGVTGVICGTVLAMRTPPPAAPAPSPRSTFKPPAEEDALDVVSRRG
jgi:hypothetical protein